METKKELDPRLARLLDIQVALDERRALYEEYDRLVVELYNEGFESAVVGEMVVELIDHFAKGNTSFTSAAVKRFALKVEAKTLVEKRAAKAAKGSK